MYFMIYKKEKTPTAVFSFSLCDLVNEAGTSIQRHNRYIYIPVF